MQNNKKHPMFWIITVTLMVLTTILVVKTSKNGGISTNGSRGTDTYKTLADAQKHTTMDLTVPSGIDTSKIVEIRSVMGQILEMRSEHYILKAALFVDVNADPMGLYDESEVDSKYTVDNSNITFFRYRTGYKGYENCTILNWCNETTSLGIMLDSIVTEKDAIKLMGLDESKISKYTEDIIPETSDTEELNWIQHKINNGNISVYLPELKSIVKSVDLDGYSILFLNDTRCIVVVYSDYALDTNVFGGKGKIDIDEHTRLNYLTENEFEVDTDEYKDYELILQNIDLIASKITRD